MGLWSCSCEVDTRDDQHGFCAGALCECVCKCMSVVDFLSVGVAPGEVVYPAKLGRCV